MIDGEVESKDNEALAEHPTTIPPVRSAERNIV